MEELDGALFRVPELVDHRAAFDGQLTSEARVLDPGAEARICRAAGELYPGLQIRVHTTVCRPEDRPMYPGKRQLLRHPGTV